MDTVARRDRVEIQASHSAPGVKIRLGELQSREAAGLVYRVYRPSAPEPIPAVVMVHGWGGDENAMWVFAQTVPEDWLLVAPRGILSDGAGGYVWGDHRPGGQKAVEAYTPAAERLRGFIGELPRKDGADLARTYLMGFSQGVAVGFSLALTQPGLIRGLAGLAGALPHSFEPLLTESTLRDLPVFLANGTEDPLVPIAEARRSEARLRAAGARVTYVEEAVGHKVGRRGMQALREWWRSL